MRERVGDRAAHHGMNIDWLCLYVHAPFTHWSDVWWQLCLYRVKDVWRVQTFICLRPLVCVCVYDELTKGSRRGWREVVNLRCRSKYIPAPICIMCMDYRGANIRRSVRGVELRVTTWRTLHIDSQRCVTQWLWGNGCHAWRQYGFSEMTGLRGVTLKSVPDTSQVVFYCTGSRSFSFCHTYILLSH